MNFDYLHDYQKKAVNFLINKKRSALFIGLGLGKTRIVLTALQILMDRMMICKPLIIAPRLVATDAWPREIEKWDDTRNLKIGLIHGTEAQRIEAATSHADIYIISRDNIKWLIEQEDMPFDYDFVAIDESTSVKNIKSKRADALRSVCMKPKYFTVLTGTPVPNGYQDIYGQIQLVDAGRRLGRTITAFRQKFMWPSPDGYGYILQPDAKPRIWKRIKDIALVMESNDYVDVKEFQIRDVDFPLPERDKYKELEKEFLLELEQSGETITAVNAGVLTSKLRQFTSGFLYLPREQDENGKPIGPLEWERIHEGKDEVLLQVHEEIGDEPALIAYNFKASKERIKELIPDAVDINDKNSITRWNNGEIKRMYLHPASAGHGLNLQHGGRNLIWYELDYNLELYDQANGRIRRQGQTEQTRMWKIIASGTIDSVIAKALSLKSFTQVEFLEALKNSIVQHP